MIPFRSGYYYFDINDVAIYDKYVILNVLFKNSVTKYDKTLEDGVSLGKNMYKFIKNEIQVQKLIISLWSNLF